MAHFTLVDPCFPDSLNRPKMTRNIQFSASNSAKFYRNGVKIKQYLNCSKFQHSGFVYSKTYNYPFGRPSRKMLFTPCPQLGHNGSKHTSLIGVTEWAKNNHWNVKLAEWGNQQQYSISLKDLMPHCIFFTSIVTVKGDLEFDVVEIFLRTLRHW